MLYGASRTKQRHPARQVTLPTGHRSLGKSDRGLPALGRRNTAHAVAGAGPDAWHPVRVEPDHVLDQAVELGLPAALQAIPPFCFEARPYAVFALPFVPPEPRAHRNCQPGAREQREILDRERAQRSGLALDPGILEREAVAEAVRNY